MGAAGVPGVLSGATILLGGEGSTSLISSYSCCCCFALAAGIVVSASESTVRGIWALLREGEGSDIYNAN